MAFNVATREVSSLLWGIIYIFLGYKIYLIGLLKSIDKLFKVSLVFVFGYSDVRLWVNHLLCLSFCKRLGLNLMADIVTIKRRVLFGDCDPAGTLYAPKYSNFSLEAIHEAFDVWLGKPGLKKLLKFNILLPVRAFSIELLNPVYWDEELDMKIQVLNVGQHSMSFNVEGLNENKKCVFKAEFTLVSISKETKAKVVVPEKLRELLA